MCPTTITTVSTQRSRPGASIIHSRPGFQIPAAASRTRPSPCRATPTTGCQVVGPRKPWSTRLTSPRLLTTRTCGWSSLCLCHKRHDSPCRKLSVVSQARIHDSHWKPNLRCNLPTQNNNRREGRGCTTTGRKNAHVITRRHPWHRNNVSSTGLPFSIKSPGG